MLKHLLQMHLQLHQKKQLRQKKPKNKQTQKQLVI